MSGINSLLELYNQNRISKPEGETRKVEPFSREDLAQIPVELRATVKEIYSTDLVNGHLDPLQSEKLSNFLFKNPYLLNKLSALGDFQVINPRLITAEVITDLQIVHKKFLNSWRGDPAAALKYAPDSEKTRIEICKQNFLSKFNKPPPGQTPGFLISHKDPAISAPSLSCKLYKNMDKHQNPESPSIFLDNHETQGNQISDLQIPVSGNLEDPALAELEELSLDETSISANQTTEERLEEALNLNLLFTQGPQMTDEQLAEEQSEMDQLLHLNLDELEEADLSPCAPRPKSKETKTGKVYSVIKQKVSEGLQNIGEGLKSPPKPPVGEVFTLLNDVFVKSEYEDLSTTDFKETLLRSMSTNMMETLAAFISASLVRTADIEARMTTLERESRTVQQQIEEIGQLVCTLKDTTPQAPQAKEILTSLDTIKSKLTRVEESTAKLLKEGKKPSPMAPTSLLCFPTDGKQTSFYEPVVRSPCSVKKTVPAPVVRAGGLKTPLERAKEALASGSKINPPMLAVRPPTIPDLRPPVIPKTTTQIPNIPNAREITAVKVTEVTPSTSEGATGHTAHVAAALKAGLPIKKYLEDLKKAKELDSKMLGQITDKLSPLRGKNFPYSAIYEKLSHSLYAWSQSNPPAYEVYDDLSLFSTLEEALIYLYALLDITMKY